MKIIVILLFLLADINFVIADEAIGIFTGAILTKSASVTAGYSTAIFFGTTYEDSRVVDFDKSAIIGIRYTCWSKTFPCFNVAAELSEYSFKDYQSVSMDCKENSVQILMCWSENVSDMYPAGKLQPYIGIGVFNLKALTLIDFSPEVPRQLDLNGGEYKWGSIIGVKWMFSEKVGMFMQYHALNIDMSLGSGDTGFSAGSCTRYISFLKQDSACRLCCFNQSLKSCRGVE